MNKQSEDKKIEAISEQKGEKSKEDAAAAKARRAAIQADLQGFLEAHRAQGTLLESYRKAADPQRPSLSADSSRAGEKGRKKASEHDRGAAHLSHEVVEIEKEWQEKIASKAADKIARQAGGSNEGGAQLPPGSTALYSAVGDAARKSGRRDLSTKSSQDKLSSQEKTERRRLGKPEDPAQNYIGFRFGSAEVHPNEMNRMLAGSGLPTDLSTVDSRIGLRIKSYASRPGSESDNFGLSEERGRALEKAFRERGFLGPITIEAEGEDDARRANKSLMEIPSDQNSHDQQDDARFRVAVIEIVNIVEFESDVVRAEGNQPSLTERWQVIEVDKDMGELIFKQHYHPLGEFIRGLEPLGKNPIFDDPSADPSKLAEQAYEILEEALGNAEKALVKMLPGSFYEILVRNPQKDNIARKREPYFEAISHGLADGLDPHDDDVYRPSNALEQFVYEEAKRRADGLSKKEQYQLSVYLTDVRRLLNPGELNGPRIEFHRTYMGSASYYLATKEIFNRDKHFDRE